MKPIKRNVKSHKEKKKDLNQKLNMFDRLPDHCLTCNSPYDKKDRQQAQTWFVVVRNAEQKVHLYCPECWQKAQDIAKDFFERKVEENVSEVPNI